MKDEPPSANAIRERIGRLGQDLAALRREGQEAAEKSAPSWGVMRKADWSGSTPEEDCCHFDGWYANRHDAVAIYNRWRSKFRGWTIVIVRQDDIRWGKDWDGCAPV